MTAGRTTGTRAADQERQRILTEIRKLRTYWTDVTVGGGYARHADDTVILRDVLRIIDGGKAAPYA